jgi:hypothetical protein
VVQRGKHSFSRCPRHVVPSVIKSRNGVRALLPTPVTEF